MRVLVGCELNQVVVKAMLDEGHDAYSCDLQECRGDYPERHFQEDIFKVLQCNGPWDLFIAHPPCTFMSNSGVQHLHTDPSRWMRLFEAADFFVNLWEAALKAGIKRIAFENPIPHKYALRLIGMDYQQLVQPFQFGHLESKATCFWLYGLNPLVTSTDLKYEMDQLPKSEAHKVHYMSPGEERQNERSRTYDGIGKAMAYYWASDVQTELFT